MSLSSNSRASAKRSPVVVAAIAIILAACSRSYTPAEQDAMKYMRSDLGGLVFAEAMTKANKGVYLADPEVAGYTRSFGVDLAKVTLDGDGYYATVTSQKVPGIRCAVAVGTRNPLKRSAKSEEVVCK